MNQASGDPSKHRKGMCFREQGEAVRASGRRVWGRESAFLRLLLSPECRVEDKPPGGRTRDGGPLGKALGCASSRIEWRRALPLSRPQKESVSSEPYHEDPSHAESLFLGLSAAQRKFAHSLRDFKFEFIGDAETDDERCIGACQGQAWGPLLCFARQVIIPSS